MSGDPETINATTETEQMPATETPAVEIAVETTASDPVSAEAPEAPAEAPEGEDSRQ